MIDLEKLKPILEGYKAYFPSHWDDEKYKWEAVKHFQDHWNIDAENFGDMFKIATDKTSNLLASGYAYPRDMITNFAKADDEATRTMFRNLYDESQDLAARVDAFRTASEEMRSRQTSIGRCFRESDVRKTTSRRKKQRWHLQSRFSWICR